MKRIITLFLIIITVAVPVHASELEAPEAPRAAQEYMPHNDETFADGVLFILSKAVKNLMPDIAEGVKAGLLLLCASLATSFISGLNGSVKRASELASVLFSATVLLGSTHSLINLGRQTIEEIDAYGKLLLPVMTTALASSGGVTSSAALYSGTTIFASILTTAIRNIFMPLLYFYLALCVANRTLGADILASFQKFIKWLMTWTLKITLYVFTGYISITGVISGSADAMSVKATKITLSGMIPVVGNIISDASEAILVGAGVMKNAAGIYGIFTFLAICIGPILKIIIQTVILKITSALCGLFGTRGQLGIIDDFSQGMNMVLAATGAVCLLLLISTVAFMKGVS